VYHGVLRWRERGCGILSRDGRWVVLECGVGIGLDWIGWGDGVHLLGRGRDGL
jgi:hypothetical protein